MITWIKDLISFIDRKKWEKVITQRLEAYGRPPEKKPSTLKVRVWWWLQKQ
jgi:hypothetical protein